MASSFDLALFGHLIRTAIADGEDGQPDGNPDVAFANYVGRSCEAAKRRALEIAPELLALADWPLDNREPAECVRVQQASVAAIDDALPDAIEIADTPSVVTVLATVSGEDVPVAKKSSVQSSLAAQYPHPLGQQLAAVDLASLDEVRGGFEPEGSGLKFSIGIERAVFINGNLVATTVLVPKGLQLATGGSAASALPTGSTGGLGIIQNGTGNNVSTRISPNLAGTVIQNSLNDQKIQNVTTINATVNSMATLRTMSLHNAIQTGIVGSLRR